MRIETIGDATLYLGDCMEVIPSLMLQDDCAVVSDVPYGINHSGDSGRFSGGNTQRGKGGRGGSTHKRIVGDEKPFDPSHLIGIGKWQIIFGANNFPQWLAPGSLLVWAKRRPKAYGTFLSDGEAAWFSKGRGVYLFEHVFCGSSPALEWTSDPYAASAHPFQKPVAVMEWCIGFVEAAQVIFDPYMGSGTTGVAACRLGKKFVGIEIDKDYFEIACRRIEAEMSQRRLAV